MNETGNRKRADNVTGLLGGPEFLAYLRSQKETITRGFFMHIGIDDFGAINGSRGADYGNYILKSVADCMKACLSDNQRLYHLVADQYAIVDLEDAVKLQSKIADKLYSFIVSENYEAVFSISVGVIDAVTFYEGTQECRKKFEFALKQAKSMGKNGFYIFDQDDYEVFLRKGRIIAALRNAIVNNWLYSPLSTDCGLPVGTNHRSRGTDAFFHDDGKWAGDYFASGVHSSVGRDRIDYSRRKIYFE